MFGTLGAAELAVIFILALVLFGPRKLPELGRTIGKAMTEFRRASNDLKSTFEREMQSLEQENQSLKRDTRQIANEIRSTAAAAIKPLNPLDQEPAPSPETVGASAVTGAEANRTAEAAPSPAAESKSEPPADSPDSGGTADGSTAGKQVEGTVPRSGATTVAQQPAPEVDWTGAPLTDKTKNG